MRSGDGESRRSKAGISKRVAIKSCSCWSGIQLWRLLTDDGELEEAEQLFSKAVEQSPNDVNLRINYGMLLAEKNEHTAAIVQYQIALPLAPQSPELHHTTSQAH